jgi:hypothetical protein
MGRYYSGDIEGKFMFGVQDSDAADRFGGDKCEPSVIEYCFDTDHLEQVEEEIAAIEATLGNKLKIINEFFEKNDGWNKEMLAAVGIDEQTDLKEWADLQLGYQIRDKIKEIGSCTFEAEIY